MPNSTTPVITIIQPTLNSGKTLENSIKSVVGQSYKYIEYIIIDGGSSDNTLGIIQKYKSKISYWQSVEDDGIYDAMNIGLLNSSGDWLYFLGGDDSLYNETVLEEIYPYLNKNDHIIYGDSYWTEQKRKYDGKFNWYKLINKNICHQSIFYPKKVFDKYNYNLEYPVLADWELNIKLWSDRAFKFRYVNKCISNFNDFSIGKTKSIIHGKNFENDKELIIKNAFMYRLYIQYIVNSFKSYILKLLK